MYLDFDQRGRREEIKSSRSMALASAASQDNLSVDMLGDKFIVGNSGGLSLLQEVRRLRQQQQSTEAEVQDLKQWKTTSMQKISDLEWQSEDLGKSSVGYQKLRSRFISVYKRDTLKEEDALDLEIIRTGNILAHEPDVIADAVLYEDDLRRDEDTFVQLYGLGWQRVLRFGKRYVLFPKSFSQLPTKSLSRHKHKS